MEPSAERRGRVRRVLVPALYLFALGGLLWFLLEPYLPPGRLRSALLNWAAVTWLLTFPVAAVAVALRPQRVLHWAFFGLGILYVVLVLSSDV